MAGVKLATLFSLIATIWLAAGAGATVVGTYNVRYDNPGDERRGDAWSQRSQVIANLIRFHDFDLLGTQEALPHQMKDLRELLPGYGCATYGRDDGEDAGEHVAIFFKEDRFELLDSGRFWLSETPDEPGRGWDAALPRLCAWAKLRRLEDDAVRYVFNLHLDHRGNVSRHEATRLVLSKIEEIAGEETVFLVGDFNTDQTTDTYRLITESGRFADAHDVSGIRHVVTGTANRFDPNSKTESRIDHIFVPRDLEVRRFGILTDTYRAPLPREGEESDGNFPEEVRFRGHEARLPSDHFPVLAEVLD